MKEEVIEAAPLTALDRCDSCSAAAKVRVYMNESNLQLLFCGHHMRKNQDALKTVVTFDPNWDSELQ